MKITILLCLMFSLSSVSAQSLESVDLIDSNGVQIGKVWYNWGAQYQVSLVIDNNVIFTTFTKDGYASGILYYEDRDCIGVPYIAQDASKIETASVVTNPDHGLYMATTGSQPINDFQFSSYKQNGDCHNNHFGIDWDYYPAEYVMDMDDYFTPPFYFSAPGGAN